MPADRLTPPHTRDGSAPTTGQPLRAHTGDRGQILATEPNGPWQQVNLTFASPGAIDRAAAARLLSALRGAAEVGSIATWWFLHKRPGWRLRYQAADPAAVDAALDPLAAAGVVAGWNHSIYEPEAHAFGGPAGMALAHQLFHHHCRHLLAAAANSRPAAPELTVLLFSTLLRAAGLDWFEQGDVWARIAQLRPTPPASSRPAVEQGVRRLITGDAASIPDLVPADWCGAFDDTGCGLARLVAAGTLTRGLRAVLAHLFIFSANCARIPGTHQAQLATLAARTVFGPPPSPPPGPSPATGGAATHQPSVHQQPIKVREMMTTVSDGMVSAETLRAQMADQLRQLGIVHSDTIDAALRRVPRHLFVPGTPLRDAYANDAVHTKHASDGTSISAVSQPGIVAMMLHQLDLAPGQRVLELGAATGYNAALVATLVGPDQPGGPGGHVTTIDVDDDLVAGAREHLDAAGITGVEVVCADGALGYPDNAPYDRIIATVGAHDIPDAWLDQLAPDGRLVAPVRLAGAISRSLVLVRDPHGWTSPHSDVAVFMPLRGLGDDRRRTFDLTGTGQVMLQTHRDNAPHLNQTCLPGILDTPRHHTWTGVSFAAGESFEWFDLWLSCSLPNPLMRMTVEPAAREAGLVQPAFPTTAMATTSADGALAYLTIRPVDEDGQRRYEVGVIAHGATGAQLADTIAAHAATWTQHYRGRPVSISLPDQPGTPDPEHGRFVLPRAHHPIVVAWEH